MRFYVGMILYFTAVNTMILAFILAILITKVA